MNPDIEARIAACITSSQTTEYLQTLRPADDLVDCAQSTSRSLMSVDDDPDATARLPILDIDSLPSEVRANLGDVD